MSEFSPGAAPLIARMCNVRRMKSKYKQGMEVYQLFLQLHHESDEVAREVLLWMIDGISRYSWGEDSEPLRELERRHDFGAIPALNNRVESGQTGGLTVAALQALASGESCSCAVHKAVGRQPGPDMLQEGEEVDCDRWQRTTWGICQLCKAPWKLQVQDQDRGPSEHSWLV